jgi:hypothetical protein
MCKLRHWQLDLPLPSNKTVKILLKYHLPIPSKRKLPKGWVYVDEEVQAEVKEEVQDPNLYKNLDQSSHVTQSMLTSALLTYTLPAKLGRKVLKKTSEGSMFLSASPGLQVRTPQCTSSKFT